MAVPNSPDRQLAQLIVLDGPDKGKMFFIKPGKECLIGRVPAADLRLTDPGSSGRHCLVRNAGDVVFVEDLKSRNGTKVNGDRIDSRVLDDNGKIQIGTSTIELNWVATEREVPLSAVENNFAPTLLESDRTSAQMNSVESVGGSTIVGADQLVLFRAAQKQLGSTLADHMLLEVVGMGNLGFVFRAKHIPTRQERALKLIPHSSIRTPALLERFLRETRTDLDVPGAVRLVATGTGDFPDDKEGSGGGGGSGMVTPKTSTSDSHAYVAMSFIRGRSLQGMIENEKKFELAEAAAIILSVCDTLKLAHEAGVIHRDIKPANILVLEDGKTALLDLGMGRKHDLEGRSILTRDDRLDSVAFTSPEITRQIEPDGRADVYALAAVLFAILSGHRPFSAKSHIELIRKIRWENPPNLSEVKTEIPAALSALVAQCMEKDAAARPDDIPAFAAALKATLP